MVSAGRGLGAHIVQSLLMKMGMQMPRNTHGPPRPAPLHFACCSESSLNLGYMLNCTVHLNQGHRHELLEKVYQNYVYESPDTFV